MEKNIRFSHKCSPWFFLLFLNNFSRSFCVFLLFFRLLLFPFFLSNALIHSFFPLLCFLDFITLTTLSLFLLHFFSLLFTCVLTIFTQMFGINTILSDCESFSCCLQIANVVLFIQLSSKQYVFQTK